jgi:alpha-tubulin suppressor-like RCC1 family protein
MKIKFIFLSIFCSLIHLSFAQVISGGGQFSLARCNAHTVSAWGRNTNGQFGNNTTTNSSSPIMNNLTDMISVSGGWDFSLGLKNDSTVQGWGYNNHGELGDGTNNPRLVPVKVSGLTGIIAIAAGNEHSLFLKSDGTVWACGANYVGELGIGIGTYTYKTTPVKVNDLTGIISIAAGNRFSVALKNDGTVWVWGSNFYGQLGDGTLTNKTTPIQLTGFTNITAIAAANSDHCLALKNDGSVWAWGDNGFGQLGDATTTNKKSPVSVKGLANVSRIACGSYHSLALKNDGSVWSWGLNNNGQLGDNSTTNRNVPVNVQNLKGINSIAAGNTHSIAAKNNGTVWAWGDNTYGQIGDGTTLQRNIPVQVNGLCIVTEPLIATIIQTNAICKGGNNGSATVTHYGGITPYSYLWSNGQTSATATNLSAGTYTVTVTDSIKQTAITTVTITAGMITSSVVNNVTCNGGNNGAINLNVTGGSGNFSYSWSNGSGNQDISGVNAGLYKVTVTDLTCTDTTIDTIQISEPTALIPSTIVTPVTCGKNNGSLSVTASGGTSPYSYLWNTGSTSSIINNLSTGIYTVTITDAHGCTNMKTDSIILQSPAVSSSITSQTNVQCNPDKNGTATVSVNSGTPVYTYTWSTSPVQTTATATGLSAGTYFVTVNDSKGCSSVDTAVIVVLHPMPLTVNSTATIVFPGTAVTLTGGGATAYAWTGAVQNGVPFIPTVTKTYTVTGTNTSGCIDSATITITVKNDHRIIACGGFHSLAICTNGDLKAWGSNDSGGLGDGTTTQRNSPVSVNLTGVTDVAAGLYHSIALKNDGSVWAWGNNEDGQVGDGTFIQKNNPVKIITTGVKAIAAGHSHSLILKNDGTVWTWGDNTYGQLGIGSGSSVPLHTTTPVQVLGLTNIFAIASGYDHSIALKNDGTVWAWGSNGWGQLGTASSVKGIAAKMNRLAGIVAIAGGENHTLALKDDGTVWACGINNDGELGDSTYVYKSTPVRVFGLTDVVAIEAGMSHSIALKNNGKVWIWGLNNFGQFGNATTTSTKIPVQSNIIGVTAIEGGSVHSLLLKNNGTLQACGANFAGQIGDGTVISKYSPVQVVGLCAVAMPLSTTVSQTNNMCSGASNGAATVIPAGGIVPYTYAWSTGQTSATITNLSAGTYSVVVTDANSNTSTNSVTISSGAVILPTFTHVSCNGGNDGAIDVLVREGSGHYSYTWSTGATTKNVTGLTAGSYTLTLKDSSCVDPSVSVYNVNQPAILSATVASIPATCGYNNGGASVTASGGSASYTYLWSNGQTTSSINNLMPGSYTVTVTDIKCGTVSNTTVSVLPMFVKVISAISSQTNVLCNGGNGGSATVSVSAGTPAYTYTWSTTPVQTTPTATGLKAGIYFVTVTDANNCLRLDSVKITQPPPLPVIAMASATIVVPGTSVTLTGAGAASYTWTGGVTNGVSFIPATTNTYAVTGTDGNGCSNTAKVTITIKTKHHLIAGGYLFSLTLCGDGDVLAWGLNNTGQLGDGTKISKNFPIYIRDVEGITDLSPSRDRSLALKKDGTVWTWGNTELTPVEIGGLTGFIDISSGLNHSLGLKTDGTVWAWGGNVHGELGDSSLIARFPPVKVKNISGIISIAAGVQFSLALKDDGTVWAWGYNINGQLGDGTIISKIVPVRIPALTNIIAIAAGDSHALALKSDSTVWSWGANDLGELGNGTTPFRSTPQQLSSLSGVSSISSALGKHSIVTKYDGTVWAWGLNQNGQVGIGYTNTFVSPPEQVLNLTDCKEVAAGFYHSLALKNDGTVWAWGSNGAGALGDSTNIERTRPVKVIKSCASIVGVEEAITDKLSLEVFPNPNSGKFILEHHHTFQKSTLEIFNAMGEKISQIGINDQKTEIDLSNQPNGIYFIHLRTEKGTVSKKIIIHK